MQPRYLLAILAAPQMLYLHGSDLGGDSVIFYRKNGLRLRAHNG